MVDFYVSIAGSAAGTRAYNLLVGGSGPGAITAAGRGQQFLRDVFSKVPESMKMDVMGELMANPRLLGDLLSKPKTERERLATLASIKPQFIELGFIRPKCAAKLALLSARPTRRSNSRPSQCRSSRLCTRYTGTSCRRSRSTGAGTGFSHSHHESCVGFATTRSPAGVYGRSLAVRGPVPEDRALIEGIGSLG